MLLCSWEKQQNFILVIVFLLKASTGGSLLDSCSIWMTDTFNLQASRCKLVLWKYVESVNKLSIYLSILDFCYFWG